jgi:hypothetical protein
MKVGVSMFFESSGVVRQQQTAWEFAAAGAVVMDSVIMLLGSAFCICMTALAATRTCCGCGKSR